MNFGLGLGYTVSGEVSFFGGILFPDEVSFFGGICFRTKSVSLVEFVSG